MKAFRIREPGQTEIVEIADPTLRDGEVLVTLGLVGFCGSDLAAYQGRSPMVTFPRIPGHEIAAVIDKVGAGVPETYRPGQAVTVVPYTNCGLCSSCRRGRPHACRNNQTLGVQRDGAMAEKIAVPWQKLVVAEGLSREELALIEPLSVGFHAVDRGSVADTDIVAVFGCGMIGLGAIARAAARGAEVIAVDIDAGKLEVAKAIGARHAVNSKSEDLHVRLQALTSGHGPDAIIEAAGIPATYRAAVEEVAFAGRVICIGYAKEDVSFTTRLFVQKELDILGSRNATPRDFQQIPRYFRQVKFPVNKVVTRVVPLADAGAALRDWAASPGAVTKILVRFAD